MAGKGAASKGARWNGVGEFATYASTTISLAAWETRAHLGKAARLPFNRFLVRIDVPDAVWAARVQVPKPLPVGWNAIPEGMVSRSIGTNWLTSTSSVLLAVPSVIIEEEDNVVINPAHPQAKQLIATKVRLFRYDHRV
jgi:RES domain-containing protein